MNQKTLSILSILCIASILLSGCANKTGGTIRIALQSPLSGDQSLIGQDIRLGAQLSLEQLGKNLTDMGFTLEFVPYDDRADPDSGVSNARKIIADPSILCVVGHFDSGVQIPASEEYHSVGLANVSPANTNPKVTDRGYLEVNRVVGRDDIQGTIAAQFAGQKGIKSVYIVHDKASDGQGIADYFRREAESLGLKVIGFDGTEEKANFEALLTTILNTSPDLIYFGGVAPQVAEFFKQARGKGFSGMLLSNSGFDSSEAARIGGDDLIKGGGTFYSTVAGPVRAYTGAAKFLADFKSRFQHDPQPFAVQGYDAMAICLKAVENAAVAAGNKLPGRLQVAQAVRDLKDFPGITGTFNFNKNGDPIMANYFIVQVTNSDPAKWSENKIITTLKMAPPAQ